MKLNLTVANLPKGFVLCKKAQKPLFHPFAPLFLKAFIKTKSSADVITGVHSTCGDCLVSILFCLIPNMWDMSVLAASLTAGYYNRRDPCILFWRTADLPPLPPPQSIS